MGLYIKLLIFSSLICRSSGNLDVCPLYDFPNSIFSHSSNSLLGGYSGHSSLWSSQTHSLLVFLLPHCSFLPRIFSGQLRLCILGFPRASIQPSPVLSYVSFKMILFIIMWLSAHSYADVIQSKFSGWTRWTFFLTSERHPASYRRAGYRHEISSSTSDTAGQKRTHHPQPLRSSDQP